MAPFVATVAPKVLEKDSDFYTKLTANIKRIFFEEERPRISHKGKDDITTQTTRLDHNVHFLNVVNGECKKVEQSETNVNQIEADIVREISHVYYTVDFRTTTLSP